MPVVYAVATMDTKGDEIAFVARCLKEAGVDVLTVDVGTMSDPAVTPDILRSHVLGAHSLPAGEDRGTAVTAMGEAR